jgi:uncharacterized repeat protein (TIGR01451 family)
MGALLILAMAGGPRALARSQLFQTIPTPTAPGIVPTTEPGDTPVPPTDTPGLPPGPGDTPQPTPSAPPGPTPGATSSAPPAQASQPAPGSPTITVTQEVSHADVLPGEEIQYTFRVANTGTGPATGLLLRDPLGPGLELIRVSATQGSAKVNDRALVLYLGILESNQTALVVLDVRVAAAGEPGQVLLNQATAFYGGEQALSNVVAVAFPPGSLPATGANWRLP